jgi:hypothetical protein
VREVQPEVAGEVVERACWHHHEGQPALGGHPDHSRHRPVTSGHAERTRAALHDLEGGEPRVLAGLEHPHPDPALASSSGQPSRRL